MAEALARVKRQLGRDAVILNTRTGTRGGLFGIGATTHVEITAVPHLSDLPAALRRSGVTMKPRRNEAPSAPSATPPAGSPVADPWLSKDIASELGDLKAMVTDLVQRTRRASAGGMPEHVYDHYLALVESAVAEDIATRLVDDLRGHLTPAQLADSKVVRQALAKSLCARLPLAAPTPLSATEGPTIVALVGPTGVGKTTTIAKLAANYCLRENRRVGLVTIDTYRIAAVEQLKTYAQIIDVPVEVAMSPEQLSTAVGGFSDCDVILIDTAGRSQRDALKINELRGFFQAVRPHELHLVLSSTCSEAVLSETIDRFAALEIDRVIFTKLDEALGFGVIVNCLERADAQLSYVTTGQDVPDDIEVPDRARLASMILGERMSTGGSVEPFSAVV